MNTEELDARIGELSERGDLTKEQCRAIAGIPKTLGGEIAHIMVNEAERAEVFMLDGRIALVDIDGDWEMCG